MAATCTTGKVSTAEDTIPQKQATVPVIANPAEVKQNTEAIFKILLKDKFSHQNYTGTRKSLPKQRSEKVHQSSCLMFDGMHTEDTKCSGNNEDEESEDLIEADSIGEQGEGDADPERQNQFKVVARQLVKIADEFERSIKEDSDFKQDLMTFATSITSEAVYQSFEKTVDGFLDSHQQIMPDPSDRYKVALVVLCTKQAISLANSGKGEELFHNAVKFVSQHFPSWLADTF